MAWPFHPIPPANSAKRDMWEDGLCPPAGIASAICTAALDSTHSKDGYEDSLSSC